MGYPCHYNYYIITGIYYEYILRLVALIGLIPIVGPLIVKVITIPFFWLINSFGYFTSAYAIKKGYGKDILRHRLITLLLLIGIIFGYILGHLIPVR